MSKIEWTGDTLNPVVGCEHLSPGCQNCYAVNMAHRLCAMSNNQEQKGLEKYRHKLTASSKNKLVWSGKVVCDVTALDKVKRTKKPTTYFVASMGDIFHKGVSYHFLVQIFKVFIEEKRHTFQILTKRTKRMMELIPFIYQEIFGNNSYIESPPSNIWLGTSTERQQELDERLPLLMQTPAIIHFLSVEPMLSQIMLSQHNQIPDWVIIGGESGNSARSMDLVWAESLISECKRLGILPFFKQAGSKPVYNGEFVRLTNSKGSDLSELPSSLSIRQIPYAGN